MTEVNALPKWRSLPKLPVARLKDIELKLGSHTARDNGLCIMEAVAWVAGEPHSDHPTCASKVISGFLRNWNDSLQSDEDRKRLLRPLIPLLVKTNASKAVEVKRSWMAFDWLVRECLPTWLELAKIDTAAKLRALKPMTNKITLDAGIPVIEKSRSKSAATAVAARDAASKRLAPTVAALQHSAVKLVRRMIACKR
jgi:hypothetical protein